MVCVYCGSDTQVTNSRLQRRNNHIWRRRKCQTCLSIFTTTERPEPDSAFRVAKGDQLQPLDRDRLFIAVYESCKHRPTAVHDASALTRIILGQLLAGHTNGVIKREDIIRTAHQALKRFDLAAATYYAAYHPIRNQRLQD